MKKIIPILALAIVLSACISIETQPTQTPAPAEFITATLPPTKAGYVSPTPSATPAITLTPTFAVTIDPNCNDSAVLLRDVTIPDGTILAPVKPSPRHGNS